MAKDPRLEKLRNMDPVIGTFTARDLVSTPDFVSQVYQEHADTHMSLGDTSDYVSTLLRWARTNKGAVVGAIAGEYGYGKTSMAIHLWQQCEQARVVAVPPFEWHRLQDIVDATWAWVRYRLGQIQPGTMSQLDQIYGRYCEKSIQEFADEEGIPVSKVQELLERGKVSLHCHPEDVIRFLVEVSQLLEGDALQLYGPVVFTDELQVTMARYTDARRSRDEFMQDLFDLLNPLINLQGSFGLMIGVPLPTEAIISDIRPDILQRLQHCNLFIRPNTMYERDFPGILWRKFAGVFEFEDVAGHILPADTLDSIGQIAFRDDLGAGPRTVIQAMCRAIEHYDHTGQSFSPIDLMDRYLGRQIAFDAGGKLIVAVTEVLQSREVKQIPDGDRAVKLMSAFPMGCPEARFGEYGLQDAKDEIARRLYTEYLYKFPEGVSLRKLAPTERGAEPRFIELTKDFIQMYSESDRDVQAAVQAFQQVVVQEQLLVRWNADSKVPGQYIGTFDQRYPQRRLAVRVSRDRAKLTQAVEEFGLAFWFDPECDDETPGRIECANEDRTLALFCLNLLRRPSKPLNIPYIEELGYPSRKVSPVFMLALVQHLRANEHAIPEDEKRIQIPPFVRSLVDYSIQLLFGEDLLEDAGFEGLSKVGLALPQEVFSHMCRARCPNYETLITTTHWERYYATYLGALGSQAVSSSVGVLRGNRPLELPQRDLLTLFGESKAQPFKGIVENLSHVLEVNLGTKADSPSTVRFKLHPAEAAFVEMLRSSEEEFTRGQMMLRALDQHQGFKLLRGLGYREEEIEIVLKMLQVRRLVDFDTKRQYFVEVLELPDERREAILAALSDLRQRGEALAQIPDFDGERFQATADNMAGQVSTCSDVEKLEEYQVQLNELREVLGRFTKKWEHTIQTNFERIRQSAGEVLRASLPADLTRSLKSDVNWVGELVQCQALLKDKYQRSAAAFRGVENRVTTAWNAWTSASPSDPTALLALYEANLVAQSELKEAQVEVEATGSHLRSYVAWSNVLNVASRAYQEATACAVSYKDDRFQRELDTMFGEIVDRFQKKRLEALPDHEMYAEQIREVQARIDAWLRDRRDSFMEAKRFYEEALKFIGVSRYNLHAAFDHFDPGASYSNLYSEVLENTLQHVQSVEQELERYRTEILYAEQVVGADVAEAAEQVRRTRRDLAQVKARVTDDCVRQQECFAALRETLNGVNTAIQGVEQSLRGVLQKREPTPEEEAILEVLQDPRGTDLSVVIASRLVEDGGAFSLDELMRTVTSLFKKNQVIIRLEKRR